MSEPDPRRPRREDDPEDLKDLLDPAHLARLFLGEPTLWPVVAVAAVIALTLGTALVVLWLDGGNPFAAAALALLAALSVRGLETSFRKRRLGRGGAVLLGAWAFCWALGWWLARVGLGRVGS